MLYDNLCHCLKEKLRCLYTVNLRSKLYAVVNVLEQINKEYGGVETIETGTLKVLLSEKLEKILKENTIDVVRWIIEFIDEEKYDVRAKWMRDINSNCDKICNGCIFVSNVPRRFLTWIDLVNEFKVYGKIVNFWVNTDKRWVVLKFEVDDVVRRCVSVNKAFFGNRFVKVCRYDGSINDIEREARDMDDVVDSRELKLQDLKIELKMKEENLKLYRSKLIELKDEIKNAAKCDPDLVRFIERLQKIENEMETGYNTTNNLIMLRLYIMEMESGERD